MSTDQQTTVAVVAPRFPPDVGGLENYAHWVARSLQSEGYRVVVVSTHPGRGITEDEVDGLPVIRLGAPLTLSNTPINPWWYVQLRRIFRRHHVDVVNTHAPVPFLADVATYAAGRRPVVATYHAGSMVKGVGGPIDGLLRGYERWVLPRVLRRATRLVGVSPIALTNRTGRDVTISPGVDTSVFHPPADDAVRDPHVLYAGRIETASRWKGLQVLVASWPAVLEQRPDAVLEVVGDGDLVPEVKALAAELGVADSIRWHGSLSHAELAHVMRRVSVTCLPSLTESESFGMTLIEAMASGCPVVGSDVGGIPHVVRSDVDGLVVPPGETAPLAEALASILEDDALARRLGRAGRIAAEDTWDWSRQRERMTGQIEEALADGRGRPVLTA